MTQAPAPDALFSDTSDSIGEIRGYLLRVTQGMWITADDRLMDLGKCASGFDTHWIFVLQFSGPSTRYLLRWDDLSHL